MSLILTPSSNSSHQANQKEKLPPWDLMQLPMPHTAQLAPKFLSLQIIFSPMNEWSDFLGPPDVHIISMEWVCILKTNTACFPTVKNKRYCIFDKSIFDTRISLKFPARKCWYHRQIHINSSTPITNIQS